MLSIISWTISFGSSSCSNKVGAQRNCLGIDAICPKVTLNLPLVKISLIVLVNLYAASAVG
jgi:hypothetical protein